tara:strand:+ start:178 stop:294 length:117 start_codon:yes stop_codon:yes gene_type:complete
MDDFLDTRFYMNRDTELLGKAMVKFNQAVLNTLILNLG